MRPGYRILTLGCRTNRFESDRLAQAMASAGYTEDQAEPSVVVVNTCTVTHRADQQSRQLIRRLAREHPGARIVVTGCLARLEAESLERLPGVWLVLDQSDQARLGELLAGEEARGQKEPESGFRDFGRLKGTLASGGRTRALLKVQDGCDNACAYCRVRLARGRSRSLPLERALEAARDLALAGHLEIVLTGIHLGAYGRDLEPETDLTELVKSLLAEPEGPRLRLSSLDPAEVTSGLLAAVEGRVRFCPHLHLPLQAGDPALLKRMKRPYTPEEYSAKVLEVVERLPGVAVGADVMVGFPGEDRAAFERTRRLIQELPLAYLHVFPFSPRPGTLAARMAGRPEPASVKARAGELRALGRAKRRVFVRRFVGQRLQMVVETRRDQGSGLLTGLSANYLTLLLPGGDELMNRMVEVRGVEARGERLLVGLIQDSKGG